MKLLRPDAAGKLRPVRQTALEPMDCRDAGELTGAEILSRPPSGTRSPISIRGLFLFEAVPLPAPSRLITGPTPHPEMLRMVETKPLIDRRGASFSSRLRPSGTVEARHPVCTGHGPRSFPR